MPSLSDTWRVSDKLGMRLSVCRTRSCHTNDVTGCVVDKCTQIRRRFNKYLWANVDQFHRMWPSAPYFSHQSLFVEGGTLIDMFWTPPSGRLWQPDPRPVPFNLIKNNPKGLPVWDGSVKQCSSSLFCTQWSHCCNLAAPGITLKNIVCLIRIMFMFMEQRFFAAHGALFI